MKLADFGYSSLFIRRKKQNKFPPNPASREEVIDWNDADETDENCDEYAADIFALGRVFFYFLSGGIAYDNSDGSKSVRDQFNKTEKRRIGDSNQTSYNKKLAAELLESMLNREPDQRPKVNEVLVKSFFNCHQQKRATVSGQGNIVNHGLYIYILTVKCM